MDKKVKDQVQDTFSKNADAYVTSKTHQNQSDLSLITEWLKPDANWIALDLATGGGHVAKELSRSVKAVYATDLTKDMLQNTAKHLKDKKNMHFILADAEELPFLDDYFDVVTCRIAPHHFPNPLRYIQEVRRVLKPGGLFLMIDNVADEDDDLDRFYNTFEKMRDPSHVRAHKISEWEHIMNENHLVIDQTLKREKHMDFQDWVTRTVKDPKEQEAIEQFFLAADEKKRDAFSIQIENDRVQSFKIPEWKVLSH